MTIASAFNDIAVAQGGTAAKSGAITAAIDALNDALAGSDQPTAKTIEQAVRLLGEHIGGGGGTEYNIACYHFSDGKMTPIVSYVAPATWNVDAGWWGNPGTAVTKAKPGDVLVAIGVTYGQIQSVCTGFEDNAMSYPYQAPVYGDDAEMHTAIVMPAHDIYVIFGTQG